MRTLGWQLLLMLIVVPLALTLETGSVTKAAEKSEIVIGASLPLTGRQASHGRDLKWAYTLAANRVNAAGGIFVKDYNKKLKVRLIFSDNGTNTMRAASVTEKMIKVDKVDMLLGGAEPTNVMAGCMVAEKYKTYCHTAFGFPVPVWLEKKFKWSTNFFFAMDQFENPFKILKSMNAQDRPKKMAFALEDTFAGQALGKGLSHFAKQNGYGDPPKLMLPMGAKDYTPMIAKAKEAGVDCMLLFGTVEDCETFVRQLKKNNVNIPYLHVWKGAWTDKFWKDLGKDAQYVICDGFWSMDYPFEGAKELGEEYHKTFGEYSVSVGLPYALSQILFQAIEKAGSVDGAKVRQAVLTNTFSTVMGSVKYDGRGLALFPQIAAQWWDGKQLIVFPTEYAVWEVKLAPPWDKR